MKHAIKTHSTLPVIFLASTFFLTCAAACAAAPPKPITGPAHPEMVVSTAWLAEHLSDPKVVVLHIAEKRSEYDHGHIPGARFLAAEKFILAHEGLMFELPAEEQLRHAFEEAGVSNDSRVILYTTGWYPLAARGYYTFDYIGHGEHTALLDGGLQHWQAEGRQVSSEAVTPAKGNFVPRLHPEVRALLPQVKTIAHETSPSPHAILVDSRPPKRYVEGHLAGAAPLYWQETIVSEKDPVLLPVDQLRALFNARGVAPGRSVVTYCQVGLQASHTYFVARYLGYGASMYDGSYYQWNELEHLPVVKGEVRK